jgi:xanthine dehydrogenase accessory factor
MLILMNAAHTPQELDGVLAKIKALEFKSHIIPGAGHVAMPLTSLAKVLGFRTVVVDGRPRFATRERFPDVDELRVGVPSELVRSIPLISTTALVLVAHDYKYDLPVLRHALASSVGYIGMLGSTRRGNAILALLREEGVAEELLARIRVPIGLDLGAQTAPEIALAILAEILAARTEGTGMPISRKVKEGKR